jgi:4-alpha-glucanotransferase
MSRLAQLAEACGVATSYEPAPGHVVEVADETVIAVLAALGVDAGTPRAVREALEHRRQEAHRLLPPTVVTRAGSGPSALAPRVGLPEGTTLRILIENSADWRPASEDAAPPPGRHTLHAEAPDGRSARSTLIVAPGRSPLPRGRRAGERGFGLLVQLYSLLSARSWGMGDLADLSGLADWAGGGMGADFIQLNPLHSSVPAAEGSPADPSPYRPSSRRFTDPVHLRVEDVPEYGSLSGTALERARELNARAALLRERVLREGGRIDRDAVWGLKREALELVRRVPPGPGRDAGYRAFLAQGGQALEDHATWSALAEAHGPDWRRWPAGLRDPRSAREARARGEYAERAGFHSWLAWLTDTQMEQAQRTARSSGMAIGLVHDLAVGVHPGGADVWAWQEVFASAVSVGAPPDAFNPNGQDWGLPPWRPDALARAGYEPYREVVAAGLRHAGALRVDHVMGLSRLWWVPEGHPPAEGTYVRYDTEAMLGVLALEAHRAGAAVIGEDLGTVEPEVREALARRGVLGTSVLWFERAPERAPGSGRGGGAERARDERPERAGERARSEQGAHSASDPADGDEERSVRSVPLAPGHWRTDCLATATTHDLPSTAARLGGEHVHLRHGLGLLGRPLEEERAADAAETSEWLALFERLGLLEESERSEEARVKAVYRFLALTPARMVGVWLGDAMGDRRPQNVPGTSDEYPNWRLPLADSDGSPVCLEELTESPRARGLLADLRRELDRES